MRADLAFTLDPPRSRLRVTGELDLATTDRLRGVLDAIERNGCTRVDVDLARASFVDVGSWHVLDDYRRRFERFGGFLVVLDASDWTRFVAEAAGFVHLLAPDDGPVDPFVSVASPVRGEHR